MKNGVPGDSLHTAYGCDNRRKGANEAAEQKRDENMCGWRTTKECVEGRV
jgi:hypothetical protein